MYLLDKVFKFHECSDVESRCPFFLYHCLGLQECLQQTIKSYKYIVTMTTCGDLTYTSLDRVYNLKVAQNHYYTPFIRQCVQLTSLDFGNVFNLLPIFDSVDNVSQFIIPIHMTDTQSIV